MKNIRKINNFCYYTKSLYNMYINKVNKLFIHIIML